jgi:hypothetical protein
MIRLHRHNEGDMYTEPISLEDANDRYLENHRVNHSATDTLQTRQDSINAAVRATF